MSVNLNAEDRDGDVIAGFAKGLAVIEAFDEANPRLSIADAARRTGLERATARRCLLTLMRLGYADFDGKFFTLTPRILRLGHAYLSGTPLPRILQPALDRLAAETDESCSAAVLDGTEIVYVARAARRRVMSVGLDVGSRLPAYCSSMGRVLLAALAEDDALARLKATERRKLTPATLTAVTDLMGEIARVRADGYSIVDQELELGLRAVAVPVQDRRGRVVAAINVGTQAARVDVERIGTEILPRLRETARDLAGQVP
jgi:IclR family pca regulon transcriptional regulator